MNRGALATKAEIARRGLSLNQAAESLGADSGTFSKILREQDRRKPGRQLAQRIFEQFGISPTLWDEPVTDDTDDPKEVVETAHRAGPES